MKPQWILATGLAIAAGLFGCSEASGGSEERIRDLPTPDFPAGQGQSKKGLVAYPPPPYGVNTGSIIQNYQFMGYPNPFDKSAGLVIMQMADFYNPTGDATFDPAYGEGEPRPLALLIDVSAVWCGPCNIEARDVLPPKYLEFKPMKGEFLLQLFDGPTPGVPATKTDLDKWTDKYKVDYPATLDPSGKLSSLFDADAFPASFIIDTRTMRIVKTGSGIPDESFWTVFANTITNGG